MYHLYSVLHCVSHDHSINTDGTDVMAGAGKKVKRLDWTPNETLDFDKTGPQE